MHTHTHIYLSTHKRKDNMWQYEANLDPEAARNIASDVIELEESLAALQVQLGSK